MDIRIKLVVSVMLVLGGPLAGAGQNKEDKKAFDGVWQLVSAESEGKEMPVDLAAQIRVIIKAGKLTHTGPYATKELPFTVNEMDPSQATADSELKNGNVVREIYKVDGDKLICCAGTGERPKEFAAKVGTKQKLFHYRRMTPNEAELALLVRKPVTYRTEKSGTLLYVESEGLGVSAIDKKGKLVWYKQPTKGLHPDFQPNIQVRIASFSSLREWNRDVHKGLGKPADTEYVEFSDNSRGFGVLDVNSGAFHWLGKD